jgi:hypothetical protein
VDVHQRVRWVIGVSDGYSPRSSDQLAAAYRRHGQEEKAGTVLVARQRRRYRGTGPTGRTRGFLQRVTVGHGYRPWPAVCWSAGLWVLGGAWFALNEPRPVDADQSPAWNPWVFAADTLLPIVDLGQDRYRQLVGASQWIAVALVAAGWILATTAAAGAARALERVRSRGRTTRTGGIGPRSRDRRSGTVSPSGCPRCGWRGGAARPGSRGGRSAHGHGGDGCRI